MTFDLSKPFSGDGVLTRKRDFFTGRNIVTAFTDETLARAYAAGLAGEPLRGALLSLAREWHRTRNEPTAYLSEGADNPVVNWFCQGIRERYAESDEAKWSPPVTAEEHYDGSERYTVVGMLWNLEDREALTNENDIRALLEGPKAALPAPDILPISTLTIEGPKP